MVKRKLNEMAKHGQITIFVILALIIVVGLMILFLLIKPPEVKIIDEKNPQAFIESCTREAVEEAIDTLSEKGGEISPKGYITYNNTEITYLCYNENFYEKCINQRPLLVEHIENEITTYITPKIVKCFGDLQTGLEKSYKIETSALQLNTRLQSKNVVVHINKTFRMTKLGGEGGESKEINEFRMHLVHPIYNFAKIAMEIVNQESRFCNFDELGFMILHPEFDITKFITGEEDIIYRIKEVSTQESFIFAVKSCKLPPGY